MAENKILIVEDEVITGLYIQQCLEKLGYEVIDIVTTGKEAIDTAEELRPSLILMDINLDEEMDGIEAASIIYQRLNIPVIYLTAFSDKPTLEKAKLTGPFGYLLKPVDERNLLPTIEMALEKHQEENKLKNNNLWLSTVVKTLNDAIIATDTDSYIRFFNQEAERLFNLKSEQLFKVRIEDFVRFTDSDSESIFKHNLLKIASGNSGILSGSFLSVHNNEQLKYTISAIFDNFNIPQGLIFTVPLSSQPEKSAGIICNHNPETFKNIISICSFCKKIKDKKGQWGQLEAFLQKNFDILFSHGVCQECVKQYYPDLN